MSSVQGWTPGSSWVIHRTLLPSGQVWSVQQYVPDPGRAKEHRPGFLCVEPDGESCVSFLPVIKDIRVNSYNTYNSRTQEEQRKERRGKSIYNSLQDKNIPGGLTWFLWVMSSKCFRIPSILEDSLYSVTHQIVKLFQHTSFGFCLNLKYFEFVYGIWKFKSEPCLI